MNNTGKPEAGKPQNETPPASEPVKTGENVYTDPVYYYSRERRLSRASGAVRELNDGMPIKPGLSRGLFGTRGNVILFLTIILLCGMLGLASRFSGKEKGVKLGGNTVALAMVREGESLFLGIVKNAPKSGEAYIGAVDLAVSPVLPKTKEGEAREDIPVFTHRIYFNPVDSETFHIALPFGGNDFFAVLITGDEQKSVRLGTAKN